MAEEHQLSDEPVAGLPQPSSRPLFITFEGIDGSGKSTQLELCAEALRADGRREVVVTRNPGGTDFGRELRRILLHSSHPLEPMSELLLFMADRAQHMDEVVMPALARGAIVLCDRHGDSTLAYQGYGRGMDLDTIRSLNALATRGRQPDLTLLFDGDPAALARRVSGRGREDRMEGESLAFRVRVREGYLRLMERDPGRLLWVDAEGGGIGQIHEQVMNLIESRIHPGCRSDRRFQGSPCLR
jgi:dTMP kinase